MLVAEGRLEERLVVLLAVLHPAQEDLKAAAAHWCCTRLHSLFLLVSPMLGCSCRHWLVPGPETGCPGASTALSSCGESTER